MPYIQHVHKADCNRNDYLSYLCSNAPDFLWYCVQDVGSYQGQVFGVAVYEGKIAIYENYYGSCSGCGAWGEGGEPTSQEEIIASSTFFINERDALKYLEKFKEAFEQPQEPEFSVAIRRAYLDISSQHACECIKKYTRKHYT